MQGMGRYRLYAVLCALLLVGCIVASYPVAETGIGDDFSYVKSAELMAATGHIVYVGWASAMLGWLIPLGALFIKLFGASFTSVRAAGAVVAIANAVLMQRCFVRSGLNERNGTIATLAIVLSPLYLPLATTYMTDIPGLLVVVVSYYGCLRAWQSGSNRSATAWLVATCVLTAAGGTARQTGWLGLLLMVPCAFWLMRGRRLGWVVVAVAWVGSVVFMFAALRWFARQPYSLGEALVRGYFDRDFVFRFISNVVRAVLAVGFFLAPLTVAFVPELTAGNSKSRRVVYVASGVVALGAVYFLATHQFVTWLAPFVGNYVTNQGLPDQTGLGERPMLLVPWIRLVLTLLTLGSTVAALAYWLGRGKVQRETSAELSTSPPWRVVLVLLLPFSAAYTALLVHRALFDHVYDRYLLALIFVGAVVVVRMYQERIAFRLPTASVAVVVLWAMLGVAENHDLFAMERARLGAAQELMQSGVGRDRYFGGWEYDSWTQIDRYGFVNTGNIRMPSGYYDQRPIPYTLNPKPCRNGWAPNFPVVHPEYALSFDAARCSGASGLAPVEYHLWLPPYTGDVYIVRVAGAGQ